jgi:hypothetical protein
LEVSGDDPEQLRKLVGLFLAQSDDLLKTWVLQFKIAQQKK